ncbi:CIA30 family protein [Lewinella sp. W8]|uniref:CIA30 family protein n=1 Tax=Lewinella sp. W8 TaxID=2528208 RepID=UPI00210F75EB|nr:CIA30 family protein [Lewinella sp. W8]
MYNFAKEGKGKWRTQDDVVMGGRSDSQLRMTEAGYAHFSGEVSLENNGGFCSIHQTVEDDPYAIAAEATAFVLKVRGDGKKYNFRVRTPRGKHLYGMDFRTKAGESWETITLPFDQMKAEFHGEPVDVPNYAGEKVLEMQLLIGNGRAESFEIQVASIGVR